MNRIATRLALTLFALLPAVFAFAQDEHFIYGRITLVDNKTYEGPLRWGKEEIYWNDIFNAGKPRNENLRLLSSSERDELDDRLYRANNRYSSWSRWADSFGWRWENDGWNSDFNHQFSCQFGDLKAVVPQGSKWVTVEMRNGSKIELDGSGYNDVGTDIRVIDKELGDVEVYWNRITRIEFINTPTRLATSFGKPLYGTVEAFGEKFTGFIQWDHDERISTDKLDGDSDDGDLSIEFGKISSITRAGSRCLVKLKSGREIYLEGSNDVNRENRGVIVMGKSFPAIDIPWSEFDKVTFEDRTPAAMVSFDQFKAQSELVGTVKTFKGETYSGRIVYDLDEEFDYELLQGKKREFEYSVPFKNIKRLKTYDDTRCEVELKSGEKIILDDAQDVNYRNQGVLIFTDSKSDRPIYVGWDKVSEIEFR